MPPQKVPDHHGPFSPASRRNASTCRWTFPCCRGSLCPSPLVRSAIPASKSTTRGSSGFWSYFCITALPWGAGPPGRFTKQSSPRSSFPRLSQLRYHLRKLKGHGLLQRDGRRYSYRLTAQGVDVALRFLFFHKRLCGPLANSRLHHKPYRANQPNSKLETAYYQAGKAIQNIVNLLQAA